MRHALVVTLYRVLALVAPLSIVALGSAQTVLLRFKPPVGTMVSYAMTTSLRQTVSSDPGAVEFTQTIPIRLRIVSRQEGVTTVESKMGQVTITLPAGSPLATQKARMEKASSGQVSTTAVDDLGNLKSLRTTGAAGAAMASQIGTGMMNGAQGVVFPRRVLKIGDAWTASMDVGKAMGAAMGGRVMATGRVPIVYRLTGLKDNVASISVSMKGKTTLTFGAHRAEVSMNATGAMSVDASTGLLNAMNMTSDATTSLGPGQAIRQHMVMAVKLGGASILSEPPTGH